jgi:trigger factor
VKVEIKEIDKLVRELSVEVPADTVTTKLEAKFRDVQRSVTLKGFRKGKAPMDVIKRMYNNEVRGDVAEELIKSTYPDIVKEHTLRVASYPTVKTLDFTDEGGFNYTATVEIFPEIEKVNFDGMVLETREITVTDEEVDDIIELLRKKHSDVREVQREARDGDVIVVDIEKVYDPENVLAQDKFENSEVDLGSKLTVKEFKEQLAGMKVGDEKEIEVKYEEDYPDKQFAGAHLKYRAKVKAVKERILPEINDGFAKMTGEAETALELRMKIRDQLKQQKTDELNRAHRNQVIAQVCEKNEIPIPKAMVEEYLHSVIEDFKKQYQDVNEEEIRKNYEQIGVNTLRWNLLLHQTARQENIEVLPADTENLIKKFADNYKITPEQAKENLQKSGNIADLRESILEDKVIDFLVGKATMKTAAN